eukprot:5321600-Pyramimonas_sp.AAC.1
MVNQKPAERSNGLPAGMEAPAPLLNATQVCTSLIPPPLLRWVLTLVVGTDHKYMAELLVGSHAGYILHPLL